MIAIRGLTITFGRTFAVDSLDVDIPEGITGVFGPNGAGKSTLLRALAGLLRPTRGHIEYFGAAPARSDESFRRRLGYAGHESGLYGRLTLGENLELFARLYGVARGRAEEMLDDLDLREHSDTAVRELSAGLKRRSTVARALLHDPQVLLLDEPYANVDDDAAELISQAIRRWHGPGRIGLVATHGATKVRAYAGSGLVMQRGRLARFGTYTAEGFSGSERAVRR